MDHYFSKYEKEEGNEENVDLINSEKIVKDVDGDYIIELSGPDYDTDESVNISKSKLFGNYKILNKDDKLIGICDVKRFRWYLKKKLAVVIDDNTIKINFEPVYKKIFDKKLIERKTLCVVCGSINDLIKFHVVPLQFKKHFPIDQKEHSSNDIVLLCKQCTIQVNLLTDLFKNEIFKIVGISPNDFIDPIKVNIKKYAVKVRKNKLYNKNYDIEYKELLNALNNLEEKEYDILDNDIELYCNIDCSCKYKNFEHIGDYVVNAFKEKNKIPYFIEKWKENFIENMNPKYLPEDF